MQSAKIYNLSKGKGVDMKVEKYRRKYQRRRGLYERLSDICYKQLDNVLNLILDRGD